MPMQYNKSKRLYEYDENYVESYVEKHAESSLWNRTQLSLIIETLTNFISTVIEKFRNHMEDAMQLFEYLYAINEANTEEESLLPRQRLAQQLLTMEQKYRPNDNVEIQFVMTLSQMCSKEFLFDLNLSRLQESYIRDEQKEEAKSIIEAHLSEAIACSKKLLTVKKRKREEDQLATRHYLLHARKKSHTQPQSSSDDDKNNELTTSPKS